MKTGTRHNISAARIWLAYLMLWLGGFGAAHLQAQSGRVTVEGVVVQMLAPRAGPEVVMKSGSLVYQFGLPDKVEGAGAEGVKVGDHLRVTFSEVTKNYPPIYGRPERVVKLSPAPPIMGGCREDEEGAAITGLQEINTAEIVYASRYGKGFSQSLEQLGPPPKGTPADANHAGLIDSALASGEKEGYLFLYRTGGRPGFVQVYSVAANHTMGKGVTSCQHYYTDQSGIIRHNSEHSAGPNDSAVTAESHAVVVAGGQSASLPREIPGSSVTGPWNDPLNHDIVVRVTVHYEGWLRTGIFVYGGQIVRLEAHSLSRACDASLNCAGPEGDKQAGLAKNSTTAREYPSGDAPPLALLARIGEGPGFAVGLFREVTVPPGKWELLFADNVRETERKTALGGHEVRVIVFDKPRQPDPPHTIQFDTYDRMPQPTRPSSMPTISLQTSQGAVVVKNFYKGNASVTGDTVFIRIDSPEDTSHYDMGYKRLSNHFYIMIDAYSLPDAIKYRNAAEADFLSLLGVSKNDACKLNVDLRVNPSYVRAGNYPSDLSQRNYGLSFCLNGLPFR